MGTSAHLSQSPTSGRCECCFLPALLHSVHGNFCNEVIDKVDPNPNAAATATNICGAICKCYFVMQLVNSMPATRRRRRSANRQPQRSNSNDDGVATRRFSQPVKCIVAVAIRIRTWLHKKCSYGFHKDSTLGSAEIPQKNYEKYWRCKG